MITLIARGEPLHLGEDHHLIAKVEAGRGLVHDQKARLLSKRARDQHELALAAADPRVVGRGQRFDMQ
jgi:hypothetical protein